jgi:hypothetical protein
MISKIFWVYRDILGIQGNGRNFFLEPYPTGALGHQDTGKEKGKDKA